MIIVTHIPSGSTFEITGTVYKRDENGTLIMCVSYLNSEWFTDSNEFPVNEETGEVDNTDYSITYT